MRIFPASGVSSPRMHRNNVVFPPPEGPRIAANSPSCSPKETSFRTPWPTMDFLSPRTSRVGIPTGWKEVGVEIRAEFRSGRPGVDLLLPGSDGLPRGHGFLNPPTVPLPPRMTYSEAQAARVRKTLAGRKDITEKQLFGGIAFLLGGNMCVGIHGDDLIVRIEPATTGAMLKEPGAKPFDLSGPRPMAGWRLVAPAGYGTDAALQTWVARGVGFASSLPKKRPARKR